MPKSPIASAKIFISYSHADKEYRNGIDKHLKTLKRQNLVDTWTDVEIKGGGDVDTNVQKNLDIADIVLLLVSVDFLNSEYCYEKEFEKALERKEETGKPVIVPIILRACDWLHEDKLKALKAWPNDGKPIASYSDKDEAYMEIVAGLRRLIESGKVENHNFVYPQNEDMVEFLYCILNNPEKENRGWGFCDAIQRGQSYYCLALNMTDSHIPRYHTAIGNNMNLLKFTDMSDKFVQMGWMKKIKDLDDGKGTYYRFALCSEIDVNETIMHLDGVVSTELKNQIKTMWRNKNEVETEINQMLGNS